LNRFPELKHRKEELGAESTIVMQGSQSFSPWSQQNPFRKDITLYKDIKKLNNSVIKEAHESQEVTLDPKCRNGLRVSPRIQEFRKVKQSQLESKPQQRSDPIQDNFSNFSMSMKR
jgi:hypothetical protein